MNRLLRLTLTCAAGLATALALAGPAAAHEGEGVLAVESTTPGDDGLTYTVRLTWANDGHPAVDSTVTATAVGPDGAAQTPVTLEPVDQDGRYRATVPLTGDEPATVRFTSVSPAGTLEVTDQRAPATTTTRAETSETTAGTTTTTTSASADASEGETAAAEDDDGGGPGVPIAIALVVIAAAIVALVVRFVRSSRRDEESTT